MKRYYRMTVSGASKENAAHEDVIYMEGQDPVVLAFRRNNALCGMNTVSMTAPAEAFCAGTMERPERQQIAGFLNMAERIREIVGISGEIEVETEDSEEE